MHKQEQNRNHNLSESNSVQTHIYEETNKVILLIDGMDEVENDESNEDSKEVILN